MCNNSNDYVHQWKCKLLSLFNQRRKNSRVSFYVASSALGEVKADPNKTLIGLQKAIIEAYNKRIVWLSYFTFERLFVSKPRIQELLCVENFVIFTFKKVSMCRYTLLKPKSYVVWAVSWVAFVETRSEKYYFARFLGCNLIWFLITFQPNKFPWGCEPNPIHPSTSTIFNISFAISCVINFVLWAVKLAHFIYIWYSSGHAVTKSLINQKPFIFCSHLKCTRTYTYILC